MEKSVDFKEKDGSLGTSSVHSLSDSERRELDKAWLKLDISLSPSPTFPMRILTESTILSRVVGPSYGIFHFLASDVEKARHTDLDLPTFLAGNARVAGLQEDLHLSNTQYSISLTVTLIPFLSAEIPVNLILKIVGPDILLPGLLTAWGAVTTLQGGLLPGIVLYLSRFYPRARLQRRLSVIFSAASLAGAFSGLLAAAIMKMDGIGNRPGWAWIFILEGLFSTIIGAISFILVPRSPTHCALLSDVQKDYVMHCLQEDGAISEDESKDVFSWKEVAKAFRSPHVWILTVLSVFNGIILYSLS
ncbi:hypothetical protein ONZ45_g4779 [Pleurotus djamor]|nr:hypothetical protein ONZ45_g4779 [Pleurotus djamor]